MTNNTDAVHHKINMQITLQSYPHLGEWRAKMVVEEKCLSEMLAGQQIKQSDKSLVYTCGPGYE